MARPSWMENGRISDTGVPEKLAYGRFITQRDRLRHAKKMGDRRNKEDWLRTLWNGRELTPWQKKAGARKII